MSVNNLMNNIFDAKFGEIKDSITNNSKLIESNKTRLDTHLLNYGVFKQDVEEGKYNSNAGNTSSMPSVVAPDISVTGNSLYTFFDGGFVNIPFINNGGAATKWTIEPAIGNGLTFDTSTGNIRGTAIGTLPETDYSITAENSAGLSKTTIQLDILDKGNIITKPVEETSPGVEVITKPPVTNRVEEIKKEIEYIDNLITIETNVLNQHNNKFNNFCNNQNNIRNFTGDKNKNCRIIGNIIKNNIVEINKSSGDLTNICNDNYRRFSGLTTKLKKDNCKSNTDQVRTYATVYSIETKIQHLISKREELENELAELTQQEIVMDENFTNYNNTKQGSNHFQGVNVNKISQLSGSEFQSDKKELVLDLEKDETGNIMSFLLQQNNMNKQVGKKELEEALEKDTEKVVETEGFSNYKSVELDPVSTFYVGSLSVIMLYYIYRSLRK